MEDKFAKCPENGQLTSFVTLGTKKDIRIFDINGRMVNAHTIESDELSINHLNNGLYFLEINGQVKKLIKK